VPFGCFQIFELEKRIDQVLSGQAINLFVHFYQLRDVIGVRAKRIRVVINAYYTFGVVYLADNLF